MKKARCLIFLMVCVSGACAAGCSNSSKKWTLQNWFRSLRRPSPSEQVAMAFDPDDADRRREGIVLLSRHDWGLQEPHLKGYAKLLAMDDDASVRCVAARALGKSGSVKYLPNLIAALEDESPPVRWDAAVAIGRVLPNCLSSPDKTVPAIKPLRRHAMSDSSLNVRVSCIETLRYLRKREVLETLLRCFVDPNFTVRHQAHESLVYLAGCDLGLEVEDWEPILEKGIPATRPAKPSRPWWKRLRRKKPSKPKVPATTTRPTTGKSDGR